MTTIRIKVNNIDRAKAECAEAVKKALMICGNNWENHAKDLVPVDTGRLKNSLTHEMKDEDTVAIGTNVEYAKYVEFGDRMSHRVGQAHFLRDAGQNNIEEYKNIIESELKK